MSQDQCINWITQGDTEERCVRTVSRSTEIEIKHGFHQWSCSLDFCTPCLRAEKDRWDRLARLASPTSAYVPVGDIEVLAEYHNEPEPW